jgi:hypothetical protein
MDIQQFLAACLWLLLRDKTNRFNAMSLMIPEDAAELRRVRAARAMAKTTARQRRVKVAQAEARWGSAL